MAPSEEPLMHIADLLGVVARLYTGTVTAPVSMASAHSYLLREAASESASSVKPTWSASAYFVLRFLPPRCVHRVPGPEPVPPRVRCMQFGGILFWLQVNRKLPFRLYREEGLSAWRGRRRRVTVLRTPMTHSGGAEREVEHGLRE